ncbi:UNVERIFIED_CONTAM: hypothetical protein K2H54_010934 [Gekko kuhli]
MSQQHPLLVFLLLIVIGACLALLAVFFAAAGLLVWLFPLHIYIDNFMAFSCTIKTASSKDAAATKC